MASAMEIEASQNLRKQLALAVRSIQWSYAIFWSISSSQPGALKWDDGYYNGEIKTRKTVQQTVESNSDNLGLERSDQLKELFSSLSIGEAEESSEAATRPTASALLSPEDLTEAEWFFLICMSFVFGANQGLPGKALAKNQTIWLCNAHRADTKVFSRSLLAKSASIKTVVCFPHLGGVVELGTTESVSEDLNLIHRIRTSYLDSPETASNDVRNSSNEDDDFDHQILDCHMANIHEYDLLRTRQNLVEGVDGEAEASHIQSWPFVDDAVKNCLLHNTADSGDFIPKAYDEPNALLHNDTTQERSQLNNSGDDFRFESVLSSILKGSHQLILGPYSRNVRRESSFVGWTKDFSSSLRMIQSGNPQKMLKKVLFEVAKLHKNSADVRNSNARQEEDSDRNHVLSERKRREKINERFAVLGSLVPSGGKVDKVSVLDHTIEYLRGLESKVEELQSFKEATERDSMAGDAIERTSGNYGPQTVNNNSKKKPLEKKRKACSADRMGAEDNSVRPRDSDSSKDNVNVDVSGNDVSIEMRCPWRDVLVFEIMAAISKLHMEPETVQSSNCDGILSMTIRAKCKGLKAASASVIKRALHKVINKS